MKILGNVAGVTTPAADFRQTDATRGNYIHGREDILSHLQDKSNPHGVTCQQTGAAAQSHTHTAQDVGGITEAAVLALIRQELGVIEHGTY